MDGVGLVPQECLSIFMARLGEPGRGPEWRSSHGMKGERRKEAPKARNGYSSSKARHSEAKEEQTKNLKYKGQAVDNLKLR